MRFEQVRDSAVPEHVLRSRVTKAVKRFCKWKGWESEGRVLYAHCLLDLGMGAPAAFAECTQPYDPMPKYGK